MYSYVSQKLGDLFGEFYGACLGTPVNTDKLYNVLWRLVIVTGVQAALSTSIKGAGAALAAIMRKLITLGLLAKYFSNRNHYQVLSQYFLVERLFTFRFIWLVKI